MEFEGGEKQWEGDKRKEDGGKREMDAEEGVKGRQRQEEFIACCVSVSFVRFNFSSSQTWIKSLSRVRSLSLLLSPSHPSISPSFPLFHPLPQPSALFMPWV